MQNNGHRGLKNDPTESGTADRWGGRDINGLRPHDDCRSWTGLGVTSTEQSPLKAGNGGVLLTDGGQTPADRLCEAVKQVTIVRKELQSGISAPVGDPPTHDAALVKAEIILRGVADALDEERTEDDEGSLDPSLLTDGGQLSAQMQQVTFRMTEDLLTAVDQAVGHGSEPETIVDCPACDVGVVECYRDETSTSATLILPHIGRRQDAYAAVDRLGPCKSNLMSEVDVNKDQTQLVIDGTEVGGDR